MNSDSNNNNFPFVGKGWSFPPTFSKRTNGLIHREGNDDLVESLHIILTTLPGERIFDSKFGCDLTPLLFEPLTNSLKASMSERIKMSIILYEPRISFISADFKLAIQEGIMYISIQYLVKIHNSRFNMVFPFYLKEGTEI